MDPRSQRRLAGYRSALEVAQLFEPKLVTTTLTPSRVSLGGQLLADALAKVADLDAVFCNNDDLAMGVLFECQRASIAVPQRMAICGFNDLDMMHVAYPSLTSVRTPRYEIGRRSPHKIPRPWVVSFTLCSRRQAHAITAPLTDMAFLCCNLNLINVL